MKDKINPTNLDITRFMESNPSLNIRFCHENGESIDYNDLINDAPILVVDFQTLSPLWIDGAVKKNFKSDFQIDFEYNGKSYQMNVEPGQTNEKELYQNQHITDAYKELYYNELKDLPKLSPIEAFDQLLFQHLLKDDKDSFISEFNSLNASSRYLFLKGLDTEEEMVHPDYDRRSLKELLFEDVLPMLDENIIPYNMNDLKENDNRHVILSWSEELEPNDINFELFRKENKYFLKTNDTINEISVDTARHMVFQRTDNLNLFAILDKNIEVSYPFERDEDFADAMLESQIDPDFSKLRFISKANDFMGSVNNNFSIDHHLNEFTVITDDTNSYQIRDFSINYSPILQRESARIEFVAITCLHSDLNHTDLKIDAVALEEALRSGELKIDNTHIKHYFSSKEIHEATQRVINIPQSASEEISTMNEILHRKETGMELFPQAKEFLLENFAVEHPEQIAEVLYFMNDPEPSKTIAFFLDQKNSQSTTTTYNQDTQENNSNLNEPSGASYIQKDSNIFKKDNHFVLDQISEISNTELALAIANQNPDKEALSVALCAALADMNIEKTLTLLDAGADPNYHNGAPLIILASNVQLPENAILLDHLVEYGCKMNGGNGMNQGFIVAVTEENTMLVAKCLEYGGMDLTFRGSEPLQAAVMTGNLEVVKMVAEHDPAQNFKDGLCVACEEEHLPIIDYLLTKVDINEIKHEPLERAAYFGSHKSVEHLIEQHQYPVNKYDNSFVFTALQSNDEAFNHYAISKTDRPQSILSDSAVMDYITLHKPLLTSALLTRLSEAKTPPVRHEPTHQQNVSLNNQQNSL